MDPFVGEIRAVGFNFAPVGWAQCNGQSLPIMQNTTLYSIVGPMYADTGNPNTFALPNLRDSVVVGAGQSNTGTFWAQGETTGEQSVTLLVSEIPLHTHQARAADDVAAKMNPTPDTALARSTPGNAWQSSTASSTLMAFQALPPSGGGLPHNNMQPVLALNYIIALAGVTPDR